MRGHEYAELAAFVAVAEHASFARAARQLHVSPSTLSQTIKKLEERIGVDLLRRTTRSVSTTAEGQRLLARFRPAMAEMEAAVYDVHGASASPAGVVRVHAPRPAYESLVAPRLGELLGQYPQIELDLVVDDALTNIVAAGFDLGIRLTHLVEPALTAVPLGGPLHHVAVASPRYLDAHGRPARPADLVDHRCIRWRQPGALQPHPWTFQLDGTPATIEVHGPLVASHCDVAVRAALDSIGIAFVLEHHASAYLASGSLETVLGTYLKPMAGWTLCYPARVRLSTAAQAVAQLLAAAPADA